jgi:hypothetical protein
MKPSKSRNLCFVAAVALGVLVAWTAVAPGGMPLSDQQTLFGGAPCQYSHITFSGQVPCSSRDRYCSSSSYYRHSVGTTRPQFLKRLRTWGTSANCQSISPGHDCTYINNEFYDSNCQSTW